MALGDIEIGTLWSRQAVALTILSPNVECFHDPVA